MKYVKNFIIIAYEGYLYPTLLLMWRRWVMKGQLFSLFYEPWLFINPSNTQVIMWSLTVIQKWIESIETLQDKAVNLWKPLSLLETVEKYCQSLTLLVAYLLNRESNRKVSTLPWCDSTGMTGGVSYLLESEVTPTGNKGENWMLSEITQL